jgi:hypothetical protein
MDKKRRDGRITIDLLDYKSPWVEHCKTNGTTPSEAFRLVVAKVVGAPEHELEEPAAASQKTGKIRKQVRLTSKECRDAEALAASEGFSLTRWIAALVRARLGQGAQLGQFELEHLARSNLQILALGRTLNQLARVANANPQALQSYQAKQIAQTATLVKEHANVVSKVIQSNVNQWRAS